MTTNNLMSCDEFADALSDFLERDVPDAVRATMEAHALSCVDCGPLLADLRKLRLDAANLPELAPSRDLWSGIAERIETPVVAIGGARNADRETRTTKRSWMTNGLAAAALVGLTATTTYVLTKRANDAAKVSAPAATVATAASVPQATLSSPPADSIRLETSSSKSGVAAPAAARVSARMSAPASKPQATLASNTRSAEATYDLEINRLRKIVDRRRGDLDSSTVAVLEKNLRIIDDAIAQCRLALKKDPASSYLNESLTDALDNKVQLLRTAAGLPAKM